VKKWAWVIRLVVLILVLVGVGYQFSTILASEALQRQGASPAQILWETFVSIPVPFWLLAGALYCFGILVSWWLWHWLASRMGDRMEKIGSAFAISYSQLGKYAPGKGLAMMIRVAWASQAGARIPIAAVSAVYEVLTTMAAGSLLGLVIGLVFWWLQNQETETPLPTPLWHAAILFSVAILPVLPPVFNRIAIRLAGRFMKPGQEIRKPQWRDLGFGLVLAQGNWFLLGLSLFSLTWGLDQKEPLRGVSGFFHCVQYTALANVGGFLASTPGGIGVREFLLQQYLTPHLGAEGVVVVLLLRILWTASEFVLIFVLWLARGWGIKKTFSDAGSREKE